LYFKTLHNDIMQLKQWKSNKLILLSSTLTRYTIVFLSFLSLLRNYELYVHHHRLPALMDISIW